MASAFRGRRRFLSGVLAIGAVAVIVVSASLGMGWRPLGASASKAATSPATTTLAGATSRATASAVASRTPGPAAAPSPAADVAAAIASQSSWVPYRSTTYRFSIGHPVDWAVSETMTKGWAIFSGWDDSNLSVTWRTIPRGTTLSQVTDEVWKAMHDAGFTVDGSDAGTIAGLPAQILTLNGTTSTGHKRHGIIGIVVTATGRYRVELWSRPGSEANDVTLYRAFSWTFVIA